MDCDLFVADWGSGILHPQSTQEEQVDTDRATVLTCDAGLERCRDVEVHKMSGVIFGGRGKAKRFLDIKAK